MTFVDKLREAYESGDLSDEMLLKLALQYENHSGTHAKVLACLHAHPKWAAIDAADDCPGSDPSGGAPLFAACIRRSKPVGHNLRLAQVLPVAWFLDRASHGDTVMDILYALSKQPKNRTLRVDHFNDLWKTWHQSRRAPFSWLFRPDAPHPPPTSQLLTRLGLFHYGHRQQSERILLLEFDTKVCHKPSWVDAELAWYFDAARETKSHGWTRDLKSGEHGYPEWIVSKKSLGELYDAKVIDLEMDIDLATPSAQFWAYHKDRLEGKRP